MFLPPLPCAIKSHIYFLVSHSLHIFQALLILHVCHMFNLHHLILSTLMSHTFSLHAAPYIQLLQHPLLLSCMFVTPFSYTCHLHVHSHVLHIVLHVHNANCYTNLYYLSSVFIAPLSCIFQTHVYSHMLHFCLACLYGTLQPILTPTFTCLAC